jgi:ketosteroid isomerase-like protein
MPLSADDKLAILDTIARYNIAADRHDIEATVNLYTDDGCIDGYFQARAGKAFREDLQKIFEMHGKTFNRHVSTNHIIEGDGDGAVADSVLIVFQGDPSKGEPVIVRGTVVIRDKLLKVEPLARRASYRGRHPAVIGPPDVQVHAVFDFSNRRISP